VKRRPFDGRTRPRFDVCVFARSSCRRGGCSRSHPEPSSADLYARVRGSRSRGAEARSRSRERALGVRSLHSARRCHEDRSLGPSAPSSRTAVEPARGPCCVPSPVCSRQSPVASGQWPVASGQRRARVEPRSSSRDRLASRGPTVPGRTAGDRAGPRAERGVGPSTPHAPTPPRPNGSSVRSSYSLRTHVVRVQSASTCVGGRAWPDRHDGDLGGVWSALLRRAARGFGAAPRWSFRRAIR